MKTLTNEKILIGPSSFCAIDKSPMDRLIASGCKIIDNPFKRKLTEEELHDLLKGGITGLIAGLEPLNREILKKSKLKVISRCGAGISNVDLLAAEEFGIKVCSTPDAPTQAVAELTLTSMLSLLRMVPQMDRDMHKGKWTKKVGTQLKGKTVLIIGFGRIGQSLARLLASFKVKIIAVDPKPTKVVDNIIFLPIEEALSQADIITIHANGNGRILGNREFNLMKRGTFLLNAARGNLIDESALVAAIEGGTIRGAWIDTFEQEPYDGILTKYTDVILTPHVGSYTVECRRQMEMEAVNNLINALGG